LKKLLLTVLFTISFTALFGLHQVSAETIILDQDPPSDPVQCAPTGVVEICAGNFIFTSSQTIGDVHFWIVERTGGTFDDVVGYTFYEDDSINGMPGSEILGATGFGIEVHSMPFASNLGPCTNNNCFEVWMDLPNLVTLDPGTYWLGIKNVNSQWNVLLDLETGTTGRSTDNGQSWTVISPFDLPFDLTAPRMVGGEFLPIETTSLILAGAQTFSWMIPVVLSVLGIGLFIVSRKSE